MFKIWVCCLITCFLPLAFAQADNNLDLQSLEQLIAEKQYSDALIKIQELRQKPNYDQSSELIYNLGLSEWFLEQYGPALAHFRLATYLKPYVLKNVNTLKWAHEELETIQSMTLRKDPILASFYLFVWPQYFFGFSLFLLGTSVFVALRNKTVSSFSQRLFKILPYTGLSLAMFMFFLLGQSQVHRTFATLISLDPTQVYAAPTNESIDVGTLNPGDSVEVLAQQEEWWQIQTHDIPSAWVRSNNLKVHSRLD